MFQQTLSVTSIVSLLLVLPAEPARASITSLAGSAEVTLQQILSGQNGDFDQASDSFPGTSSELPLQVIAQLIVEGSQAGAAAAAAQFADPRDLNQANPEEFAVNITLNSVAPDVRYSATAKIVETRGVLFAQGELGPQPSGAQIEVGGKLFLDGALAIYAVASDRDLTGSRVMLRVTIVKSAHGTSDETVFSGTIELTGRAAGSAAVAAEGGFPTGSLRLSRLALLAEQFGAFILLIIPDIAIEYTYTAVVDQELTLRATVEAEAANIDNEAGVLILLGTPTDTISRVISLTRDTQAAAKVLSALESERENPSGDPAFPRQTAAPPFFGLCGLLGFEFALGLAGLVGLKFGVARRRFRR